MNALLRDATQKVESGKKRQCQGRAAPALGRWGIRVESQLASSPYAPLELVVNIPPRREARMYSQTAQVVLSMKVSQQRLANRKQALAGSGRRQAAAGLPPPGLGRTSCSVQGISPQPCAPFKPSTKSPLRTRGPCHFMRAALAVDFYQVDAAGHRSCPLVHEPRPLGGRPRLGGRHAARQCAALQAAGGGKLLSNMNGQVRRSRQLATCMHPQGMQVAPSPAWRLRNSSDRTMWHSLQCKAGVCIAELPFKHDEK